MTKSNDNRREFTIEIIMPVANRRAYQVTGLTKANRYYREEMQKAVRSGGTVSIINDRGEKIK